MSILWKGPFSNILTCWGLNPAGGAGCAPRALERGERCHSLLRRRVRVSLSSYRKAEWQGRICQQMAFGLAFSATCLSWPEHTAQPGTSTLTSTPIFARAAATGSPLPWDRCNCTQWPPTRHEAGVSLHRTFKSLVLLEVTLHPCFGVLLQWQIPKDGPLKSEHV